MPRSSNHAKRDKAKDIKLGQTKQQRQQRWETKKAAKAMKAGEAGRRNKGSRSSKGTDHGRDKATSAAKASAKV